jgi:DNA-binding IscR family transcriptional regulator
MARPPEGVSLLDVVEALEDPVVGMVPHWSPVAEACDLDDRLEVVCDTVAEAVRERLGGVSLADLGGSPCRT